MGRPAGARPNWCMGSWRAGGFWPSLGRARPAARAGHGEARQPGHAVPLLLVHRVLPRLCGRSQPARPRGVPGCSARGTAELLVHGVLPRGGNHLLLPDGAVRPRAPPLDAAPGHAPRPSCRVAPRSQPAAAPVQPTRIVRPTMRATTRADGVNRRFVQKRTLARFAGRHSASARHRRGFGAGIAVGWRLVSMQRADRRPRNLLILFTSRLSVQF